MAFSMGVSLTLSSTDGALTAFLRIPVIEGLADSCEVDTDADDVSVFEVVGEIGSESISVSCISLYMGHIDADL